MDKSKSDRVEPVVPEDEILFATPDFIVIKHNYNHPYHPTRDITGNAGGFLIKCLYEHPYDPRRDYTWHGCSASKSELEEISRKWHAEQKEEARKKALLEAPTQKRKSEVDETDTQPAQKRKRVQWADE